MGIFKAYGPSNIFKFILILRKLIQTRQDCGRDDDLRDGPVTDPSSVSDSEGALARSDRPSAVLEHFPPIDTSVPPPNLSGPIAAINAQLQLQQLVDRLASILEPRRDTSQNLDSAGCSYSSQSTCGSPSSGDSTQHRDLDAAFEDLRQRLAVPPSISHAPPKEVVPASLSADLRTP